TRTPASLLDRLRESPEPQAWGRFVSLYTPLIYAWGRRAGLQDPDAADLVQDVFVTLLQTLPTFVYDRKQSFRRWLKAVTLNKWRDACKRRARGPAVAGDAHLEEMPALDDEAEFWETEFQELLVARALDVMQTDFQERTWRAFWEPSIVERP